MSNTGFVPGSSKSNGGSSRFQSKPSAPQRQFVPVEYTTEEHQRIQSLLDKVLGPEYVSSRPGGGGQKVSYIEGWRALNLANEIFGFNGWNSELISTQVDFFDTHGNSGRFSMGLSVVVRVTIKDGAYHEDFGYGYIDNAKSKAMAFEKCKKEAFTDGVKRCLRCFGNVLGNCLYDRSIIAKMQKVKLPQPELEDSDFYRDPMLLEREKRRRMETKVNMLETSTNTNNNKQATNNQQNNHQNPNQNVPNNQIQRQNNSNNQNNYNQRPQNNNNPPQNIMTDGNHNNGASSEKPPKTYTPSAQELEELDASFFSDDMLDDDAHEEVKVTSDAGMSDITNITENAEAAPDPKTSKFPLFVSAKGADLVQQTPQDVSKIPQFDPKFVSPNIRRTLDPSKSAPVKRSEPISSQTRYPPSQTEGNSLGKRIGMPPSQRPANKRYRPDS